MHHMKSSSKLVVLVGGGSGGPVTPLLAVAEQIRIEDPRVVFAYFGTGLPFESDLLDENKIPSYVIPSGKLRRYFDLRNISDVFKVIFGFFKARSLLVRLRARVVFSAGSYVSVPVAYAAASLGIPAVAHQQDFLPALSNRLIFPVVRNLTVSLEESALGFSGSVGLWKSKSAKKIILCGNPVRKSFTSSVRINRDENKTQKSDYPTLLVLGGGGGSEFINRLVIQSIPELARHYEVIHLSGQQRNMEAETSYNYKRMPYLIKEFPDLLRRADVVVSRAGFSTISEIAACKKLAIIIPMPDSHQIANAEYLDRKKMAFIARQEELSPLVFIELLRRLKYDLGLQKQFQTNIGRLFQPEAAKNVAEVILKHL